MSTLRFNNVSLELGGAKLLSAVTLDISLSRCTFIVGRSGSGKSLTCRIASGLLRPTRGEVWLDERPVHALPERELIRMRTAYPYVVQSPALVDWMSAVANVRATGATRDEALELLARVGLKSRADDSVALLGPGERKRVAIARALAHRPRSLFLDEPTTSLDRIAAETVLDTLQSLRREGVGLAAVSHDYRAVRALADDVVVIDAGTAAFHGSLEEFLRSRYVPASERLDG